MNSREKLPVADTSHGTSGVADRYASSLFELALEAGAVDAVGSDLDKFQALLDESEIGRASCRERV